MWSWKMIIFFDENKQWMSMALIFQYLLYGQYGLHHMLHIAWQMLFCFFFFLNIYIYFYFYLLVPLLTRTRGGEEKTWVDSTVWFINNMFGLLIFVTKYCHFLLWYFSVIFFLYIWNRYISNCYNNFFIKNNEKYNSNTT